MTKEKFAAGTGETVRGTDRMRTAMRLRSILHVIMYMAAGFFFPAAELPFGARILGVAFVCGVSRGALGVTMGVCVRSVTEYFYADDKQMIIFAVGCVVACTVRYAFSFAVHSPDELKRGKPKSRTLCDPLSARLILSVTVVLAAGTAVLIKEKSGFSGYDFLSLFFSAACAAAFTLLFSFAFEKNYKFTPFYDTGTAAVIFSAVLSFADVRVFGLSAALIAAMAATLYIGYYGGAARACLVGLLCGIACGGIYIPLFAVAGLASGIFFSCGAVAGAGISTGVFILGALISGNTDIFSYLPEALIGAAAVAVPAALGALPDICLYGSDAGSLTCRDIIAKKRESENTRRIEGISETMGSLSSVLRDLSDKLKMPDRACVEKMCRDVWKGHCSMCDGGCSPLELCSGDGNFIEKFALRLMKSGHITADRLEGMTKSDCPHLDDILHDINVCAAKMMNMAASGNKTDAFAFDYGMAARILADTAAYSQKVCVPDRILTEKLRRAFLSAGLAVENLAVCGTRKKYIVACGGELARTPIGADDIRALCEKVCSCRFSAPEFIIENGGTAMTLSALPAYEAEFAVKQSAKDGEEYCGDSASFFSNNEGYAYSFVCDGMGSGREAALTARLCRVFLEKMLGSGNKKSTALEMLNMIVAGKGVECFATVDLLEIDTMLGTASFIKSGAAPSYVIRGESLFKISGTSAPVGIMPELISEMTEFELHDGDIIVLASDGIAANDTADGDGGMWLAEFLENADKSDINLLAEEIAAAAKRREARSDDMTVEIIRIKTASRVKEKMQEKHERTVA